MVTYTPSLSPLSILNLIEYVSDREREKGKESLRAFLLSPVLRLPPYHVPSLPVKTLSNRNSSCSSRRRRTDRSEERIGVSQEREKLR